MSRVAADVQWSNHDCIVCNSAQGHMPCCQPYGCIPCIQSSAGMPCSQPNSYMPGSLSNDCMPCSQPSVCLQCCSCLQADGQKLNDPFAEGPLIISLPGQEQEISFLEAQSMTSQQFVSLWQVRHGAHHCLTNLYHDACPSCIAPH